MSRGVSWVLWSLALGLSAGSGAQAAEVPTTDRVLSASAPRVAAPPVDVADLRRGSVERGPGVGHRAVSLEVTPPPEFGGWRLTVRRVAALDGPAIHWKLDDQPVSAYHAAEANPVVVVVRREGGEARVDLDLRWDVDWSVRPGNYGTDLEFSLEPL